MPVQPFTTPREIRDARRTLIAAIDAAKAYTSEYVADDTAKADRQRHMTALRRLLATALAHVERVNVPISREDQR